MAQSVDNDDQLKTIDINETLPQTNTKIGKSSVKAGVITGAAAYGIDLGLDLAAGYALGSLGTEATIFASLFAPWALAGGAVAAVGFGGYKLWSDKKVAESEAEANTRQLYNAFVIEHNRLTQEWKQQFMQYNEILTKIRNTNKQLNQNFATERLDPNIKVIVAIGPTGFGKSLFCNRMIGDTRTIDELEDNYDKLIYKVAEYGHTNSITQKPQKHLKNIDINSNIKLCVVDTPGEFDSNNFDEKFENINTKYFRDCGGINIFCIFFKFGERLNSNYQKLLKKYETFYGGEKFWQHCVIIVTHCDYDTPRIKNKVAKQFAHVTNSINQDITKIRYNLNDNFESNENKNENEYELEGLKVSLIPTLQFGVNNYKESKQILIQLLTHKSSILSSKYQCDNIRGPIDDWLDECKSLQDQLEVKSVKLNKLRRQIDQKATSLNLNST